MIEHTCSYYCERPECIRAQRDELRDRKVDQGGCAHEFIADDCGGRARCHKCGNTKAVDQGGAVAVVSDGFSGGGKGVRWKIPVREQTTGMSLYARPHDPALAERLLKEFENCEDSESISSKLADYVREAAAALVEEK